MSHQYPQGTRVNLLRDVPAALDDEAGNCATRLFALLGPCG
jgi:hypothetical protein